MQRVFPYNSNNKKTWGFPGYLVEFVLENLQGPRSRVAEGNVPPPITKETK